MPDASHAVEENVVDTGSAAAELSRLRTRYSHTQPATTTSHQRSSDQAHSHHPLVYFWHTVLLPVADPIGKFWSSQISVRVPHDACRDHLALERTFLSYLRTSLALSSLGVAIAQLFRLQHTATPNPVFGFYTLGKPLACICQGAAIYCLGLGAYRSWRLQNAIIRGKAISGGFELVLLGLGVAVVMVAFWVLIVAVDIDKDF